MTDDDLKTESNAATGLEASVVERIVMCDFDKSNDTEFRDFVEQLPDKCWAKYDLSAVRLGWEAHKLMD